ncbi:hypothetical protein [Paraburkholderia sp.]|jgi:hypothetical protein|uniref:hypothetical protein n=1 Tax=Paraburkholderia sp. TaxID=1926495 RepID=UPI002F4210F9
MDRQAAYAEIERNGGAAYARSFAARYPEHPFTPFCHRYLFEQTQRDEAAAEAATAAPGSAAHAATHDDERGFALKSLARMEASSHIAQAAANASRDAAAGAHTSARAARRSAFWTMIAALASALGVVVNAALNLGWLEWARHMVR